ncbi:MAG: phenylalanine--tRNA ligase subunit beta [Gammaproteobacteria bacterium]|nr:phenylalanine--tRNA ligase subunit beta [Gammaproteobacteria bacterium]
MKFSEQWLREWANPAINVNDLADQITMAGLEVDSVVPVAGEFSGVIVAEIISLEKHPDADKLNVCQVNNGTETIQIVCGAANARAGLKAPLATIGAVLPGNFNIKKSKLRGVESFGMLCAETELAMAESSDGLMELASDATVGMDIRDYLQLDDQIIEIELTPNRSDCLSIQGVAREVATLNNCELTPADMNAQPATIDDVIKVNIAAGDACPHYLGRVIRNVNVTAETPLWMQEKLRRSGFRSHGPVVDVTNYVLMELGQPMHAFDLDKLNGDITVRMAAAGEEVELLDGKKVNAAADTLLITDAKNVLALAGIMGGEWSSVTDDTRHVFFESAYFTPDAIAGRARRYGLHTDSSHRFERGVDPALQSQAIERATELLLQIAGGEAGPVIEETTSAYSIKREAIHLRKARIKRILGIELADDEIEAILTRLGMQVAAAAEGWLVTAPSFRFDITIESDLIEELIRIHGYNNIPRVMPVYQSGLREKTEKQLAMQNLRQNLLDHGYFEAVTYSFVDPEWCKALAPDSKAIALANPMSSEMSVMRTTLWAGMLKVLQYNLNRQQSRVRLFETGLRFIEQESATLQQPMLAGVATGPLLSEQWAADSREIDFFDIKGDVEALLALGGGKIECVAEKHPALHPGQSAKVIKDGQAIGWIGALHPELQKTLDLSQKVYVFELELGSVCDKNVPKFNVLSKFPEVRRDISLLVDQKLSVSAIKECVVRAGSEVLKDIIVFDVYAGKGVSPGLKSVALGLILQDFSRTLIDDDVDQEIQKIVSSLEKELNATLRE